METIQTNQDDKKLNECFERTVSALTVDDVYNIAKLIGSDVEKLIDNYGRTSVESLVPKIVKVLELLESFTASYHTQKSKEESLLRAFETLQVQQHECNKTDVRQEWQQKEQKLRLEMEALQKEVLHLQEENQELLGRLQSSLSKEDRTQRQEREVMLKLKEVVDKQRDELRAKVQEISKMSKEVEALQEQLDRFMKMNGELRSKQNMMQVQLKSAAERRVDLEVDLSEKDKEIERLVAKLEQAKADTAPNTNSPAVDMTYKVTVDPNKPCFTKQEVRDILFERNELKANLFLVQEELAFYQREILNDERYPGFLLGAVRGAIKKQRTIIKAKMLGIPEDDCSSDEEKGPLFEKRKDEDCPDSKPPESRIRTLFGYLSRSGSDRSGHQINSSAWEIINTEEHLPEVENGPGGSP
ncbi:rab-interacting lysosomal protein isoform X1 [Ictalurus punctatus]|uniref:RILP-like protein 2 n=1 Tax=Ictalurus punctatus TaxID=7998 RepID=A0A2D0STK6_ICTPU|nr:rab-interacting lysosomal protein isoform X1 [Ictalurus punctatus]